MRHCLSFRPFFFFFWPLFFFSFCPFSFGHCISCPFCDLRYLIILLLSSDFTNKTIMLFLSMLSIWLFSVLYRVLSTQTVCIKEHDMCMNLVNVVETSEYKYHNTFITFFLIFIKCWIFDFICRYRHTYTGADPGFQVKGKAYLKKNAPSGGRRENFCGISCEKSRFYAKKSYFPSGSAPAI